MLRSVLQHQSFPMTRYISVVAPVNAHVPTAFQYFSKFMTHILREKCGIPVFHQGHENGTMEGLTVEL